MSTLHHEDLLLSIFDEVCEDFPILMKISRLRSQIKDLRICANELSDGRFNTGRHT